MAFSRREPYVHEPAEDPKPVPNTYLVIIGKDAGASSGSCVQTVRAMSFRVSATTVDFLDEAKLPVAAFSLQHFVSVQLQEPPAA